MMAILLLVQIKKCT